MEKEPGFEKREETEGELKERAERVLYLLVKQENAALVLTKNRMPANEVMNSRIEKLQKDLEQLKDQASKMGPELREWIETKEDEIRTKEEGQR